MAHGAQNDKWEKACHLVLKLKIGFSKQKDGGGSGSNVTHRKVLKLNQGKNGSSQNKNGNSQAGKDRHKKNL
jgi:hypothetical protein